MIVYVCGPISGDIFNDGSPFDRQHPLVRQNIQQAAQAALELWQMGHTALTPHLNTDFEGNHTISHARFVDGDLSLMAVCDCVLVLPGYETSRGAIREMAEAKRLGMSVYFYPDLPPFHPTELRSPVQARAFREVMGQMYRTHLKKNADYSPANIQGTGTRGVVVRLWDKVARLMNLTGFGVTVLYSPRTSETAWQRLLRWTGLRRTVLHIKLPDETVTLQPLNESREDTWLDAAVYSVIGLLHERNQWGR